MNNIHFVILAGGSGQRLWPLSTKNRPKHLIPFIGQKSLLQQTIDRILPLATSHKNIWIITNQDQLDKIKEHVGSQISIIAEPTARNTAPAILFTCHKIQKFAPGATIVILPADHFIPNQQQFLFELNSVIDWVQGHNKIATIGIHPTFAATGYGYIQAGESISSGIFNVEKFHEKPNIENATKYISQKNMFWNGGIFVGKLSTFLNEFEINAPKLASNMNLFLENKFNYQDLENISIDYAIMEKSKNIVVIPTYFEWSDVGNLSVFISLQQKYQPNQTEIINLGGQNNLAKTDKKLIICISVSDLCIVETDNIILISKKDDVELVKQILPQVQKIPDNTV